MKTTSLVRISSPVPCPLSPVTCLLSSVPCIARSLLALLAVSAASSLAVAAEVLRLDFESANNGPALDHATYANNATTAGPNWFTFTELKNYMIARGRSIIVTPGSPGNQGNAGFVGAGGNYEKTQIVGGGHAGQGMRVSYPPLTPSGGAPTTNHATSFQVSLPKADEYYMAYWVKFDNNWATGKAGKLPGLAGVVDSQRGFPPIACNQSTSPANEQGLNGIFQGFSTRSMWNFGSTNKPLINYVYYRDMGYSNAVTAGNTPTTKCDTRAANLSPDKGCRCGVGELNRYGSDRNWNLTTISLNPNTWYHIQQRVRMNTPGVANGVYERWVNGVKDSSATNVKWRATGQTTLKIDRFFFMTYYGGPKTWSPTSEGHAIFDDIVVSTAFIP